MAGLKKIGRFLSFKRRLVTGKSVYMSRMSYGMEVWGPGVTFNQLRILQASQKRLLSWITKNPPGTSTRENLNQCGLLSVNQLIILRVLTVGLKVL